MRYGGERLGKLNYSSFFGFFRRVVRLGREDSFFIYGGFALFEVRLGRGRVGFLF